MEIIVIDLPEKCWPKGYPIHKGESDDSLNYATVYANENNILPNQKRLHKEHQKFKKLLASCGIKIHLLPFPDELDKDEEPHHDGIFIRDSGFMFKDSWIKANFSCKDRVVEADVFAKLMSKKFKKKVIELPENALLEFGEVFYFKTKQGSFYFGGVSRSNKQGHDFVRKIIQPDNFCLIKSEGYHLDTVFSPVLNKDNELCAFIVTKGMFEKKSLKKLKDFNVEIIFIDPIDSSGEGKELGNYAVNSLVLPGFLLSCSAFLTSGVEEKLAQLGVKHLISPLTDFRFAGGSYHCLTNEIYD